MSTVNVALLSLIILPVAHIDILKPPWPVYTKPWCHPQVANDTTPLDPDLALRTECNAGMTALCAQETKGRATAGLGTQGSRDTSISLGPSFVDLVCVASDQILR